MVVINLTSVKDAKRASLGKKRKNIMKKMVTNFMFQCRLDALKRHKSNQRNKQGCTDD